MPTVCPRCRQRFPPRRSRCTASVRSDTCSSAAADGNLSASSRRPAGSALMTVEGRDRDAPWMMRTYSGHSTAAASNALYRTNLAKGQTGLSIAFDLPTQTGYDPDSEWARGEVGKVGVPVAHLGHMRTLLDGIPPGEMNTSMTINATGVVAARAVRRQRRAAGGRLARTCAARRRTTSSRSTCRAARTSSRPSRRGA